MSEQGAESDSGTESESGTDHQTFQITRRNWCETNRTGNAGFSIGVSGGYLVIVNINQHLLARGLKNRMVIIAVNDNQIKRNNSVPVHDQYFQEASNKQHFSITVQNPQILKCMTSSDLEQIKQILPKMQNLGANVVMK